MDQFLRPIGPMWAQEEAMLAPKMAPKSRKNRKKQAFKTQAVPMCIFIRFFDPKMTSGTPKIQCLSLGVLVSNAYRRFQLNHGFFSLLGANMTSSWHPKSMKNRKKRRCQRVSKKSSIFKNMLSASGALLEAILAPSWRPGRPKTAPKSAQETPETAPETLLRAF